MALLVPIDNLLDAPKFVPEIFAPTLESVIAASVFVGRFLTVSVSVFGGKFENVGNLHFYGFRANFDFGTEKCN